MRNAIPDKKKKKLNIDDSLQKREKKRRRGNWKLEIEMSLLMNLKREIWKKEK